MDAVVTPFLEEATSGTASVQAGTTSFLRAGTLLARETDEVLEGRTSRVTSLHG